MRTFFVTKNERKAIDIAMIAGGVIGPLSALPQIFEIFSSQDAGSVSLISWLLFFILSIVGIVYSVVHKEKVILLGYILYALADLSVVIGVLLYG